METDREESASTQGREDTSVEDGESASVEGVAGGVTHKSATGDQSRQVTRRGSGAALEDGEKHTEGRGSESHGHSIMLAGKGAPGSGSGAESGNGSEADQAGGMETGSSTVRRADRDRVDMGHLRDTSNLSNYSHHGEETVRFARDDVRVNDDLEADSTGSRETSRLYHRPASSSSTGPSSPSAENPNEVDFSMKDKPLQIASGSRGGEAFSGSEINRHEEVGSGGSIRERRGDTNDGIANGEMERGRRGVHSGETVVSTKDKPRRRAGGSRGGEVFSRNTTGKTKGVDGGGFIRERRDENSSSGGVADGEPLRGVREGVHGANIGNKIDGKRGRGDQEYPGFSSTKSAIARGAVGDVENSGFANDGSSGAQARGDTRGDAAHAEVPQVEDVANANEHQTTAQPRLEERGGRELRGGDVRGTDSGGATVPQKEGSRNSNTNDDGGRSNKDGGEARRLLVEHGTTDRLSARGRERPTSDGEDRNLLQHENLGAETSDGALTSGDIVFDKRVGAGDDREPGSGSSDPKKLHEGKGGDLGSNAGKRREDTPVASVPGPQGSGGAGGASVREGKEGVRDLQGPREVRDRWTSSLPGGIHVDDGVLSVQPEEYSLQEDGSSTVSSFSSGRWRPSPTKSKEEREAGGEREREQDEGLEGRVVSGDGPGRRRKRQSAGAGGGTGGGSHDASSSADNKGYASRRQVCPRMS